MEKNISPEEARAEIAKISARMFKKGRGVLIVGITIVGIYSILVPSFKHYSPRIHALYLENEIFYTYNLWLGVLLIFVGVGMMLHAKVIDRKYR